MIFWSFEFAAFRMDHIIEIPHYIKL